MGAAADNRANDVQFHLGVLDVTMEMIVSTR